MRREEDEESERGAGEVSFVPVLSSKRTFLYLFFRATAQMAGAKAL